MKTQVAIVGGGPAGSSCAIYLSKLGISSVIIERETFPRFHIGESLTEQSGYCLRELGFDDASLSRKYPIKRSVSIYGPAAKAPFVFPVMRRDSEGNLQTTYTWQVRRSDFDHMLLERARETGATVMRARAHAPLFRDDGAIRGLAALTNTDEAFELECDVLVDASGQGTFLSNAGVAGPKMEGKYCRQIAIYSHFSNVTRDPGDCWGDTLIYFQKKYHWAWFIPLDEHITSIGFVLPVESFRSRNETVREFLLRELQEFNRDLAARTAQAEFREEVRTASNYSYEVNSFTGKGWLCVGDAHRFIDPLFSFGVSIALTEARHASRNIEAFLQGRLPDSLRPFQEFESTSNRCVAICQTVVDSFWESTMSWGLLAARYREDMIDLLQGHVWDGRSYRALSELSGQHQHAAGSSAG